MEQQIYLDGRSRIYVWLETLARLAEQTKDLITFSKTYKGVVIFSEICSSIFIKKAIMVSNILVNLQNSQCTQLCLSHSKIFLFPWWVILQGPNYISIKI